MMFSLINEKKIELKRDLTTISSDHRMAPGALMKLKLMKAHINSFSDRKITLFHI